MIHIFEIIKKTLIPRLYPGTNFIMNSIISGNNYTYFNWFTVPNVFLLITILLNTFIHFLLGIFYAFGRVYVYFQSHFLCCFHKYFYIVICTQVNFIGTKQNIFLVSNCYYRKNVLCKKLILLFLIQHKKYLY